MKNNKGFTLIELLAVITILAIIMLIAIPNVVSVIEKQKKNTYVNDAMKLISRTKYTVNSNTDIPYPDAGKAVVLYMNYVNNGDLDTDPNGYKYDIDKSFVAISLTGDGFIEYWAQLVSKNESGVYNGIPLTKETDLSSDRGINYYKKKFTVETSKSFMKQTIYGNTSSPDLFLPESNIFNKLAN